MTSDTNYETAKKQIYNSKSYLNLNLMLNQCLMIESPADIHGMWYPTVRRSLMCLSKLYRSLDVRLLNEF